MAVAGDLIQSSERSKILGFLEASNGLGKVISPLAGAALVLISWFTPFFVYGILSIPIAFLILFFVKEGVQKLKKNVQPIPQYMANLKKILKDKWLPLLIAFLSGLLVLFSLFGLASPVLVMAITAFVLGTVMQKKMTKILKWGAGYRFNSFLSL